MRLPQKGMIELEGVGMRWGHRVALEDVSLKIDEGDFVAITGPNGGGKTTMLRIILRLLQPSQGQVIFRQDNKLVKELSIGYLPQKNMIDHRFPINVEEVIASGLLSVTDMSAEEQRARVADVIAQVGLESHARSAIGNLSGGQLQRALLGRAIISQPRVLALDEPLSYVDKRFENRIYALVSELAPRTTILMVTHEMSRISTMANRHLIVNRSLTECSASHHYVRIGCDD